MKLPTKEEAKEKLGELAHVAAKIALGSVALADPVMGPIVAPVAVEMYGTLIPQRRLDRVERMLVHFVAHLADSDPETVKKKMYEPDFIDFFEQCSYQATQARTEERLKAIAGILATAITNTEEKAKAEKCLSVIGRLDNADLVLLLTLYEAKYQKNCSFEVPELQEFGNKWFATKDPNDVSAFDMAMHSLQNLQNEVLAVKYTPDDVYSGMLMRATVVGGPYYKLTDFGRLLCRFINGGGDFGKNYTPINVGDDTFAGSKFEDPFEDDEPIFKDPLAYSRLDEQGND